MNSLAKSLGRIAKHLPNTTLDDPLNRITVDDRGRVWVTEDTTLLFSRDLSLLEPAREGRHYSGAGGPPPRI
jgi:hypothetical protein